MVDGGAYPYGYTPPVIGNRYTNPTPNTPSWVSGLTDMTFNNVSTNTMADVEDPLANSATNKGAGGQPAAWYAWNGATMDTNSILCVAQGGHSDYGGNEVYRWDMQTATWSRPLDSSVADSDTTTDFYLSDGSVRPGHTWNAQCVIPGERHIRFCMGSRFPGGSSTYMQILEWNPTSGGVIQHGVPPLGGLTAQAQASSILWDPVDELIIYIRHVRPDPQVFKVDPADWSLVESANGTMNALSYGGTAIDPDNHWLFGCHNGVAYAHDLDNFSNGLYTIPTTVGGPPSSPTSANEGRMQWTWHVDGFITWVGYGSLLKATPNADYTTMTYTTHAVTGDIPSWSTNGMYGRAQAVKFSGKTVMLICSNWNSVNGDVIAIPLPDAGVS